MKFFIKIIFFSLSFVFIFLCFSESAKAEYSKEYVIDDAIMLDKGTMSAVDINNFLASKGSWLANYNIPEYISVPYPLSSGGLGYVDTRQFNDVTGEPLYGKNVAQLIYDEAQSHNVNPRVIITILQKESSAITRNVPSSLTTQTWPLFYMYDESMESCLKYGTNCNDSAFRTRSIMYGGIGQQIAYATAWFKVRYDQYFASQSLTVTVDGTTFTCTNAATRILYIYTPHIVSWQNFHTIFTSYFEDPTFGPPAPNQPFEMSYLLSLPEKSWNIHSSGRSVSGDFDGDGESDILSMYDYGNEAMGLFVFESSNSYKVKQYLSLPPRNWSVNNCGNLVSGDFDKSDEIDDIAIIYNYGNESIGLWVFESSNSFGPSLYRYLPPGNWNFASSGDLTAGDFDGVAGSDLAILYDYGNSNTGLWAIESGNSYHLRNIYVSGPSGINLKQSKGFVSGNFDNNGFDDISIMYDYGNSRMGIIQFKSVNNWRATVVYAGESGSFCVARSTNIVKGDFDNNGDATDLAVIYDYGDGTVGIFAFNSANSYSPLSRYWSGRRNFSMSSTNKLLVSGDFNSDNRDDVAIMYTYGNESMALFSFFRTEFN